MNRELLKFEVLSKQDKNYFKTVQSNAKFKEIKDVIKTKVGINNFYNFGIAIKSTIILRDIILNSQFVSGWARSSQVLNSTDSKFSIYKFLFKTEEQTKSWINLMEDLERNGHSMDNMRSLIYLDSVGDYAISIDILHLLYLCIVLHDMSTKLSDCNLKEEVLYFVENIDNLLKEYDVNYLEYLNMFNDAIRDFPSINCSKYLTSENITLEPQYNINATYSVVGQIWRHRTLVKVYSAETYDKLVNSSKELTKTYDYSLINVNETIVKLIKDFTENANSVYDLCQGTIIPFNFSGTTGAVYKALSQRTCYINDSPQFKDAFKLFERLRPELPLLPPCKLNATESNSCYVGYVNESRIRGEEKTQIPCPIYCKAHKYDDMFKLSISSEKTKWYCNNLKHWENICK